MALGGRKRWGITGLGLFQGWRRSGEREKAPGHPSETVCWSPLKLEGTKGNRAGLEEVLGHGAISHKKL